MNYFGLAVLVITVLWLVLFFIERRTLWIGGLLLIWLGVGIPYLIVSLENVHQGFAIMIAVILIGVIILAFPFYLLSFILMLIMSGVRLIKREGKRFRNFLSLALGLFLIIWLVLSFYFLMNIEQAVLLFIVGCITLTVYYFFGMLLVFALSSILNRVPMPFKTYDYIIVLGSGLIGDKVPPLLASRIQKGLDCFKRYHTQKRPVKVVFTGGRGRDEEIPEGVAMAKYAKAHGLEEAHMIIEDKAVDTYENMLFSKQLIDQDHEDSGRQGAYHILTVTNNFHVFRALLWAKKVGVKSDGRGVKTRFYFWLNALIREFIGVLYMQRMTHIVILGVGYVIILFLALINYFYVLPFIS